MNNELMYEVFDDLLEESKMKNFHTGEGIMAPLDFADPVAKLDRLFEDPGRRQPKRLKRLARIDRFGVAKTALTAEHRAQLQQVARDIRESLDTPRPIRLVHIVGHAATWRNITSDTYAARARGRARNTAEFLKTNLADLDATASIRTEQRSRRPDQVPVCKLDKSVDVTLCMGDRSDSEPLVSNMVKWATPKAQDNRARNRRVDLYLYVRPRKAKPKPGPKPPRKIRPQVGICYRHCGNQRKDIEALAHRSIRASRKAHKRFEALAAMPEAKREQAWNAGREKVWFGPYRRGGKVPFLFVRRTVGYIWKIFRGKPSKAKTPCANRMNHLTIECFRCPGGKPSDSVCFHHLSSNPIARRWRNLEPENRKHDALFVCCNLQDDLGFSLPVNPRHFVNPMKRQPETPPHRIGLAPTWLALPSTFRGNRKKTAEWHTQRRLTIVHEVAHLAGAIRLFGERYGARKARRLARLNPWSARVNADNYAAYIMEFAP